MGIGSLICSRSAILMWSKRIRGGHTAGGGAMAEQRRVVHILGLWRAGKSVWGDVEVVMMAASGSYSYCGSWPRAARQMASNTTTLP